MDLRLVESVQGNARRYVDVFSQAVDTVMPKESTELTYVAIANLRRQANWEQVQR